MRFWCIAAMLVTAFSAWADSDLAGKVAGWSVSDGVYHPEEPWTEGTAKATGLEYPFPRMPGLAENPLTKEKVGLGRLLFFDPILSDDNTMSCAHCHHPDHGFTDGLSFARGVGAIGVGAGRNGGQRLSRGTPSLWNAAYSHLQFWDGRAPTLEEQARAVITNNAEMNEKPDNVVKELRAIPEYVDLFEEAFENSDISAVNFENVIKAVASFERTLLSFNSRFDRYTQGDPAALTGQEKRGLAVFRSVKTRCFECHRFPAFMDDTFRVVGVPGSKSDPGRAAVPGEGPDGAFKVPTLRNVELTAPYMHNGAFKTLEEVINFYSNGGGRAEADPVPDIDDKIGTFPISETETADLVAFLKSLTDTSLQPAPPDRVPSGLPVVPVTTQAKPAPPLPENVVAYRAAEPLNAEMPPSIAFSRADTGGSVAPNEIYATFTVKEGDLIQEAVDRARPGDRIEIQPGVYNQTVTVDRPGIRIVGLKTNGQRAVLDGKGELSDAIQCSGDDFTVEGLLIRDYVGNGIVVSKAKNCVFRDLNIHNTGLYGVYPVECQGVLVERCVVSGIADAGIYVGQSREIVVRDNEVYNSVAGIEIENSVNAVVENNSSHHNAAGLLVFCAPNNPSKEATNCKVMNNRFWSNNHINFGKPGSTVSGIAPGMGLIIMAADQTEVAQNSFDDNGSFAIVVVSVRSSQLPGADAPSLDIEPNSDNTYIHNNFYRNNGTAPSEQFKRDYTQVPPGDLFWDGTGESNQWDEDPELVTFPKNLLQTHGGIHTDVVHFL
ncbi:MAG: parallel beta-helix domain-containing protein [Candidatus Hydrogenedentota bacterium]